MGGEGPLRRGDGGGGGGSEDSEGGHLLLLKEVQLGVGEAGLGAGILEPTALAHPTVCSSMPAAFLHDAALWL